MADQVLGEALLEIRASQEKLVGDVARIADTLVGALQKVEKQTDNVGLSGLAKEIQEVARATEAAEKQIQSLKFAAIADEVGQLTSALKGAESGVQITEDLARAESLLEERFGLVRAEIQRQADAQRGLVDEEVLLERTTLQLEAAQRQHDAALATVRGRALQAAEGLAALEAEEQASALAAQKAWAAVGRLALEQQQAEQSARSLAEQEARTAQGLANLGTVITLVAEKEAKATTFAGELGAAHSALTLSFGRVASAIITVNQGLQLAEQVVRAAERAFNALVGQSVEVGDAMNRAKQSFALSADTLSGLRQAASDVDLTFDDVRTSLKAFTDLLANAAGGSKEAEVRVAALGINIEKLRDGTLSTDDAFRLAIDKLSKMEDGFNKSALQADAFGRSGTRMGEAVRGGAAGLDAATKSAREMGNAFDDVALENAARLDDQLDELKNRTIGLANAIGKNLTPASIDAAKAVNEWVARNDDLIVQRVQETVDAITASFKGARSAVDLVESALAQLHRSVDAFLPSGVKLSDIVATLVRSVPGMQQFGVAAVSLAKFSQESQLAAMRGVALTATLDGYAKAVQATENPSQELLDQTARIAAEIKELSAKYPEVGRAIEDYRARQKDAAKATGEASDAAREHAPNLSREGDAAKKAAKEFAELANKLADTSAASADYAIEQIDLAGETGDLTAIESAHADAIVAVEKAYQDGLAAIEANKRAGEEQKLLDAELVKLEQDKETALRKVAKTTAAATAVTKQYAIELEQVTLDQLALEADQAAREMQKLVRAGAANIVIQQAAAKAAEKEKAVRDQQVKIIRMQEGAQKDANKQTIISAGATNAAAKAADQYSQRIEDLNDQLRQAKLEDPLGKLDRKLGESADDITLKLDELLHGDKGFGQFVEDLKETLLGSNGPGAIIDAMGAAAEHGLRDLLKETVNFGTDIVKSLVNDVTEPITNGLQHLEEEIVKGIENLAEDAWDAITDLFGGGQSREQQLAEQLGKSIGASFTNDAVRKAVIAGAEAIGDYAGESLVHAMAKMPVSELHKGIHDVVTEAFAGESAAVQTEIQQLAQAAGTAVSASLGYVGGEAIAFSQAWAASWIRAQVQAGKSTEQIIKSLEAMDKSLGTNGGIFAALDELNAKIIETGKSGEVFEDLSATIKDWTGKKTDVQSLSDVLAAFGGDAVLTLNAIKKSLEDNGIAIEQFGDDLGDVVLAFTGAGEAIKAATEDYRDFGNEADGTADILRQKVLSGLDDVIASAKDFPVESVEAFRSAIALIPPEMLASSEFVNALREDFARMAVESHMSVQELVDSIDPPLPEATRNAILAVNDLGKAIGDLTGAPLKNLKEVTDRMKQFGSEMYREVKDAEGNVTRELTAFGQELIDEASTAISGMWSQMNEDGWVGLDEIGVMFDQLALLPVEALNDPAIQQATRDLLAKIGAMTGDAAIIAMANAETITQDMIDQGLAAYEEYKKDIEENPPEVPPPGTDGQPTTDPTQDPTAAATGAPPPQPIPPETTASYQTLADTATEYAKAVLAGKDAVEALAATTVEASARMLAAIKPIYGTPTDEGSFSSIARIAEELAKYLPEEAVPAFQGFGIEASAAVSSVYESAVNATSAMHSLTDEEWVVKVRYEVTGAPPSGPETPPPPMAAGGWIPGLPSDPYPITAHGGELVVPEATASTLPPDLVARLLSGSAFDLPASMVSRLSYPVGVPSVASVAGAGAAASTPALDSEWTALPVRKRDLLEGAVLEVARATETGRARIDGRRFRVSPTYGRRQ